MEHTEKIIDTDKHFEINPITREIENLSGTKKTIIQYDHNSERISFSVPRMYEGHDMKECNQVEIHYINADSASKEQSIGIYPVTDMTINPDDETKLSFSWLISQNATRKVGSLLFLVRFACVADDGSIDYAWHTALCDELVIQKGMWNSEMIVEQHFDVLEQWRIVLLKYIDEAILGGEW